MAKPGTITLNPGSNNNNDSCYRLSAPSHSFSHGYHTPSCPHQAMTRDTQATFTILSMLSYPASNRQLNTHIRTAAMHTVPWQTSSSMSLLSVLQTKHHHKQDRVQRCQRMKAGTLPAAGMSALLTGAALPFDTLLLMLKLSCNSLKRHTSLNMHVRTSLHQHSPSAGVAL
eukprot:GHRR01022274.1.p1 GENE.GHRR01022274.1~~GHRR01022274.1.p1  ORF type:complete len:171 (-),score=35.42 GHRR01022274.1:1467-1979(-)